MNAPKLALDALPNDVRRQVEKLGHGSKTGLKRRPADRIGVDKTTVSIPLPARLTRMARDEAGASQAEGSGVDVDELYNRICMTLTTEERAQLCAMLSGSTVEDNDLEEQTSEREQREETGLATMTNDDPPNFPGMPRKGGTMVPLKKQAADSGDSYSRRFPGAKVDVQSWTGSAR
jgi:hypothetical protein